MSNSFGIYSYYASPRRHCIGVFKEPLNENPYPVIAIARLMGSGSRWTQIREIEFYLPHPDKNKSLIREAGITEREIFITTLAKDLGYVVTKDKLTDIAMQVAEPYIQEALDSK